MKRKYEVVYNNTVIGTRKSERYYTHAVVIVYADGTTKVESYSNGLDKAQKVARTTQNYLSKKSYEITPTVVIVEADVVGYNFKIQL